MKNLNAISTHTLRRWGTLLISLLFVMSLAAQNITVRGVVKDAGTGETIIGANVVVKGTTSGTITDASGNFSLSVPANATLSVSYLGYETVNLPVDGRTHLVINLKQSAVALNEVVAIGYGTVKKGDATGSVVALNTDKMNKGQATSLTDLLAGQTAGVTVTTSGGAPGAGANIIIRGGSSLYASNAPLIVVDGVPLDNNGVSGLQNPLSTINPDDIATFTILKDASATAIYGSRASNGVILITTKKGRLGQKIHVSYQGNYSVSTVGSTLNVLSGDQFRNFMDTYWAGNKTIPPLYGKTSTDWQKLIFTTASGTDQHLSVSGSAGVLPYRVSVGYTTQNGILKTGNYTRTTAALNLNPSFLDDHLKFNINLNGSYNTNRFADQGAIGAALQMDPTQSVMASGQYGAGYWMALDANGNPIKIGIANPVAILNDELNYSYVYESMGSAQVDYKFYGLPDLHAKADVGYDITNSNGNRTIVANSPMSWVWGSKKTGAGEYDPYHQQSSNTMLDVYLDYNKTFGINQLNAMLGYSWQHFFTTSWNATYYTDNTSIARQDYPAENYLLSFFGRLNYTLLDRYLFTFTLRNDGTSRFAPGNRWGLFPSGAFAWKIKDESFLKNVNWLSDLKLRLGYGQTGQQDIGGNYYPYIPTYNLSPDNNTMYSFGSTWYHLMRSGAYNTNIKWETTTTYNIGLDYGFLNGRFTGSVDLYKRVTSNMLNNLPVAAGTNFTNILPANIGSLENKGLEVVLGGNPIQTRDFTWNLSYNMSYNKNTVTKLTRVNNAEYGGIAGGDISGGTGNTVETTNIGYPAWSFYVYQQAYNSKGQPIEGVYVDRNGDGIINSQDLYVDHNGAPSVTMGLSSRMTWKKWLLTFTLRSELNNYVYNNVQSNMGFLNNSYDPSPFLKNILSSALTTNFKNAQYLSDYYVQNASFLKMDNASLGYTVNKYLTVTATVQNVFTITNYKGLDPEVQGGIDKVIYPRPHIFLIGANVNF
jgi:iron complex outermembrane receptor protein